MAREIRLPAAHPRFRPRLEAGIRRVGHPGTTIRIGEDLFEVVSAERSGTEWVYRLEPWTGRDTIRVYVEWNEEAERGFMAGLRDSRNQERKDFIVWGAQAFIGFLPAEKQEQLRQTRGLDPARATLWSAILETGIAAPLAAIFVINLASGGAAARLVGHVPFWAGALALGAVAEGLFRLAAALSSGEPIGSLPFTLLDGILRPKGQNGPSSGPGRGRDE